MVVARRAFLEAQPEFVKAILQAHVDAAVQFNAEQPDTAKKIVNAEIERITSKDLPPGVVDSAFRNTHITTDPLPATIQA